MKPIHTSRWQIGLCCIFPDAKADARLALTGRYNA